MPLTTSVLPCSFPPCFLLASAFRIKAREYQHTLINRWIVELMRHTLHLHSHRIYRLLMLQHLNLQFVAQLRPNRGLIDAHRDRWLLIDDVHNARARRGARVGVPNHLRTPVERWPEEVRREFCLASAPIALRDLRPHIRDDDDVRKHVLSAQLAEYPQGAVGDISQRVVRLRDAVNVDDT